MMNSVKWNRTQSLQRSEIGWPWPSQGQWTMSGEEDKKSQSSAVWLTPFVQESWWTGKARLSSIKRLGPSGAYWCMILYGILQKRLGLITINAVAADFCCRIYRRLSSSSTLHIPPAVLQLLKVSQYPHTQPFIGLTHINWVTFWGIWVILNDDMLLFIESNKLIMDFVCRAWMTGPSMYSLWTQLLMDIRWNMWDMNCYKNMTWWQNTR